MEDRVRYKTRWVIRRYPDEDYFRAGIPAPVPDLDGPIGALLPAQSVIEGNVLLNEGIGLALDLWIGGAGNNAPYDAGNAYLGVGDNNTAGLNTQTGLLSANNKAWVGMSNGYPSRANQTLTFQAVFGNNTALFPWQEFTIVNANNDTGLNLNRVANNQGTKAANQIWTLSAQITLS